MFNGDEVSDNTWAEKTYSEITEIAERDGSVLLIPIGSIEQHGHHLPVATDSILVEEIAGLGADWVGDDIPILVTPTMWSGFSPHHLPFGGTITLEFETILNSVEEIADSAIDNGFDAVLLLNGHGGNQSLISSAVKTVGKSNPETEILGLTYFNLAPAFVGEIRDSESGGMSHGGEFETSLMLYLHPDLVRDDKRDAKRRERVYSHESDDLMSSRPLSIYRPFDEYSASGAIGDPELASADKGERIYKLLGDELKTVLRQIHDENR